MGCLWSKCRKSSQKQEFQFSDALTTGLSDERGTSTKLYSWDTREKVDPKDYTVENLSSGEEVMKRPGEANGQQMIIRNCSSSRIYIFDHTSTVTIDDCVDCLIVLGPVQRSVFLRDTTNSTLVCSASQLRLRDCKSIHLFVGIESDPIIEASTEVVTAPYFLYYNGIEENFKSANINRFRATHWANIYDFTPNDVSPNWRRFKRELELPEKFICSPNCPLDADMRVGDKDLTFIPITYAEAELHGKSLRRQETTFKLEGGMEPEVLEQFMEKFYKERFVTGNSFLCDIRYNRNEFVFVYYSS